MRRRLLDVPQPESASEWKQYSRLKLPNVFAPTQASYKLGDVVLGNCARKTYYEQLKVERASPDERAYSIFDYGSSFEDRQIENYKIAGIYVADHVPISFYDEARKLYVSGEVDAIVKLDSELIGVEFKTSYGYRFLHNQILGYAKKTKEERPYLLDKLSAAPKPEHLLQVALYLYYFTYKAQPPVPKITEWRIVYQDRGTCMAAEYMVQLRDAAGIHLLEVYKLEEDGEHLAPLREISVEGILDRFRYVLDHIETRTIPPRDFNPFASDEEDEDWQCRYCLFRQLCVAQEQAAPVVAESARRTEVDRRADLQVLMQRLWP